MHAHTFLTKRTPPHTHHTTLPLHPTTHPPTHLRRRHIGFIALMLPDACLVHAARHPADTALSCYAQPFEGRGTPWASNLTSACRRWLRYRGWCRGGGGFGSGGGCGCDGMGWVLGLCS